MFWQDTVVVSEKAMKGEGFLSFLVLGELKDEDVIKRSCTMHMGRRSKLSFHKFKPYKDHQKLVEIAIVLVINMYWCVAVGKRYRLPSTSQGYVWRSFQATRNSDIIVSMLPVIHTDMF